MVRVLRNLLAGLGCLFLPFLAFGLVIGWADYSISRPKEAGPLGLATLAVVVVGLVLLWWVSREIYRWRRRRQS